MARQLDDVLRAITMSNLSKKHVTEEIRMASDLTPPRLAGLCELAEMVLDTPGDIAEVGVFKGGSAKLLQSLFPTRDLWLFDTFAGNPERGEWDSEPTGSYCCSRDKVELFVSGPRVHYVEGIFPDTFRPRDGQQFAFVHLDCDQYASVKRAAEAFRPLLSGIIVCDDYKYLGGARRAFDEVFGPRVLSNDRQAYAYGDCFQ